MKEFHSALKNARFVKGVTFFVRFAPCVPCESTIAVTMKPHTQGVSCRYREKRQHQRRETNLMLSIWWTGKNTYHGNNLWVLMGKKCFSPASLACRLYMRAFIYGFLSSFYVIIFARLSSHGTVATLFSAPPTEREKQCKMSIERECIVTKLQSNT